MRKNFKNRFHPSNLRAKGMRPFVDRNKKILPIRKSRQKKKRNVLHFLHHAFPRFHTCLCLMANSLFHRFSQRKNSATAAFFALLTNYRPDDTDQVSALSLSRSVLSAVPHVPCALPQRRFSIPDGRPRSFQASVPPALPSSVFLPCRSDGSWAFCRCS